MTPREIDYYLRGSAKRRQDTWKRVLWGAWHTEAFARAKRLPSLKKELAKLDRIADGGTTGMTVEEISQSIHAVHAAFVAIADKKKQKR